MGFSTKPSEGAESRKMFPEARYELLVVAADERPIKNGRNAGRPQAVIDFEVTYEEKSKTITVFVPYFYETKEGAVEQSMFLDQMIAALVAKGDPENLDPGELIGRRCYGELVWEKEEWPRGSGRFNTKERLQNLERHEGGPVFEGGAERVEQKQTAAATTSGGGGDDSDLPFDLPFFV